MRLLHLAAVTALPMLAALPAAADQALWQGALDHCLEGIELVEYSTECQAEFVKICVNDAYDSGIADADVYCLAEEEKAWGAKMTAQWDMALKRAEGLGMAAALQASQAAWVAFQTAECAAAESFAAPDGQAAQALAGCRLETTMQRYIRLRLLAEGAY